MGNLLIYSAAEIFCALRPALPTVSGIAGGQTYPTGPITMVVPYPAAGLFDAVARVLVEPMRKVLGRPVVIDALLS
jgi:tripartite-type tricarboxylate transporter receptor subunit TctC